MLQGPSKSLKISMKVHRLFHRFFSSQNKKRVVITGLGTVSPLGIGTDFVWQRLLQGKCGITAITDERFAKIPSRVAGYVPRDKDVSGSLDPMQYFTASESRQFSDSSLFAACATEEALLDAQWKPSSVKEFQDTGVSIGSSIMSLDYLFEADRQIRDGTYKKVHPHTIPRSLVNMPAGYINMKYGFMGASNSVSTACATGAHSIIDGFNLIRNDDCNVVVCGATDSEISPAIVSGFCRCKALCTKFNDQPELASRPFDKERDGFVIAEGAGIMVLEDYNHARNRDAKIYAEILGYGLSSDAYHITNPRPDAAGVMLCIHKAIRNAGIEPEEVSYINAHSTSTPAGDKTEALAIANFFGSHRHSLKVSSIKGAIGHLLAAAGSVESIATVLACHHGLVPPSINIKTSDVMELRFSSPGDQDWPNNDRTSRRIALKNSFGFGGTNACIVFSSLNEHSKS